MKTFSDEVMQIIRHEVEFRFNGNILRASEAWGVTGDNLYKWLKGSRTPTIEKISPILDKIGVNISIAVETSKEVHITTTQIISAEKTSMPPKESGYIAIPVVGDVGAGNGYIPDDVIKSWFMANKELPSIRHKRNLIAVEVGITSTSMTPTLRPGDTILIDRDDKDVSRAGKIMLVLDPRDGSGMVKRVSVTPMKDSTGDYQIVYYSDNAQEYPPQIYSLLKDFDGDITKAIVGRAIWAWVDISGK